MSAQLNRTSRRQLLNSTQAYTPVNPEVAGWIGLVYYLATASVDNTTAFAVDNFVSACKAAQIWSSMVQVNVFATSPLNNFEQNRRMALTPLVSPIFITPQAPEIPWQSSGGTPLVTSTGYCPNGNFYLNTGINFSVAFPNSNSVGMSLYHASGSVASGMWAGSAPGFTDLFFMQQPASPGAQQSTCMVVLANVLTSSTFSGSTAQIGASGFYSSSRTSATLHSAYRGNSTGFFLGTSASLATAASSTVNTNLTVFQLQSVLNSAWYCPTTFMSFLAFHQGLNAGQTQQLFQAVQAMRQEMKGGFV